MKLAEKIAIKHGLSDENAAAYPQAVTAINTTLEIVKQLIGNWPESFKESVESQRIEFVELIQALQEEEYEE